MNDIDILSEIIIDLLRKKKLTLGTMESCTSGSLCSALTNISGSSDIVKGGIITYCTEMKIKYGVSKRVIKENGVYSNECSIEMARCAKLNMNSDIGIGITGCLGTLDNLNSGGTINKVYYTINVKEEVFSFEIKIPNKNRKSQKEYVIKSILENLAYIIK